MDLYVYYRARTEDGDAVKARVFAVQRSLSQEYGIVASLKRRPAEKDGRHTWMEVYQAIPPGFEASLEKAIDQSGLMTLIDGQRHTEYFQDVPSCA